MYFKNKLLIKDIVPMTLIESMQQVDYISKSIIIDAKINYEYIYASVKYKSHICRGFLDLGWIHDVYVNSSIVGERCPMKKPPLQD